MTWGIHRLQEAIVEVFSADLTLISLTNDGVTDDVGSIHHIGIMLDEPGVKERLPYVGIAVANTVPAILNEGYTQQFRSTVLVGIFSRDECVATLIADRVQSMLTYIPGNCMGYLNFTNDHIRNLGTEFYGRPGREFNRKLDVYEELIEMNLLWSPIPCDSDEIIDPECPTCDDDIGEDLNCEYDSP